jgi:hypothetical protein
VVGDESWGAQSPSSETWTPVSPFYKEAA